MPITTSRTTKRLVSIAAALLALPTALIGPGLRAGQALLPADLLIQFEPWKSQVASAAYVHWDPLVWDGIAQYFPWRAFAAESLRSGILPLWNPYQFCGTPFIANGQSAVFYPLNLMFVILPVALAFGWSAWLHLVLTGWFAYLFLRRIGTGRIGAVAGAVIWQGNGFFIAWIHLPTVLCTAAWLPLILLLIEKAVVEPHPPSPSPHTEKGLRYASVAGLALGISYLGGHPQIFLFVALLTTAYTIARGLSREAGQAIMSRLRRLISTGTIIAATAAGIASIQFLPTLDLLRIAHRTFTPGPESYRAFLSHAMPALQLGGLLTPHAFGHPALGSYAGRDNYAEFACYIGIVALALALWSAFTRRTWQTRFFGLTVLIVFLIVIGTAINQPLYRLLPGFARAGGPGRMLVLAVFAMSILAGMGADKITRVSHRGLTGLMFIAAALAWTVIIWHTWVTPSVAQIQPGVLDLSDTESHRASLLCFPFLFFVVVTAFTRRRAKLGQVALATALALDLFLASHDHLHIVPTAWVYPPVRIAAPAEGRVLGNAKDWPIDRFPNAVLPPNSATVYHLRDAFGYDSLYLSRYRDFAAALQHGDPSPPLNGNMLLARLGHIYGLDMMSLASVETVMSPIYVRGLSMETAGAYYTYSNPYARPRAWVATSALFVPTHNEAVVALAKLGPPPDTIIITGPDDLDGDNGAGFQPTTPGAVTLRDLSSNSVEVVVKGRGGGYLLLADAYAPGWRAYASGRELTIRPADVAFRAVAIPADATSVLFRYEPDSFRVGLFITLLACAALTVLAGSLRARRGVG